MTYLITFDSTHQAIAMEEKVNQQEKQAKIISIPCAITAGCGLGLKMTEQQFKATFPVIKKHLSTGTTIYTKTANEYVIWQPEG